MGVTKCKIFLWSRGTPICLENFHELWGSTSNQLQIWLFSATHCREINRVGEGYLCSGLRRLDFEICIFFGGRRESLIGKPEKRQIWPSRFWNGIPLNFVTSEAWLLKKNLSKLFYFLSLRNSRRTVLDAKISDYTEKKLYEIHG